MDKPIKIISVVGARPNFMKVAPLYKAFKQFSSDNPRINIEHLICHTGQHFDEKMSKIFFDELELPIPDYYLGVSGGSHAEQTARIMIEFEKVLIAEDPKLVVVVGDVNSTIACSLTAVKMGIEVAHVEAGLRSYDRSMPEEINRILTDSISEYLFVTERSGLDNLINEGMNPSKVYFVGNCMIDSLIFYLPKINSSKVVEEFGLTRNEYVVATFHRPSNVDGESDLKILIGLLNEISKERKIIFPIHPRTRNNIEKNSLLFPGSKEYSLNPSIILTDPLGYIDFMALVKDSTFVITDSGGIQEETTYLGVPCITLRKTTERPCTSTIGTNYLVGEDFSTAGSYISSICNGSAKKGRIPELWDGSAAKRIVEILIDKLLNNKAE